MILVGSLGTVPCGLLPGSGVVKAEEHGLLGCKGPGQLAAWDGGGGGGGGSSVGLHAKACCRLSPAQSPWVS